MTLNELTRDAILRVGEVSEVNGRRVTVKVDREKNLSELFLDGEILRNVSVNSYIEIRKGFSRIIGKVDGERIEEDRLIDGERYEHRNKRFLNVSLLGFIDRYGIFTSGMKELPLIGNETYVVTKETIQQIHNLVDENDLSIRIATTDDDVEIDFPVDRLFNGHIAILGNTGSGKSNTLAMLYQEFIKVLRDRTRRRLSNRTRFLLFDFNGEYIGDDCITTDKLVYNLAVPDVERNKLPMSEKDLIDLEFLATLGSATEKTQKPFLKRAIALYYKSKSVDNMRKKLRDYLERILRMQDGPRSRELLDYMKELIPEKNENGILTPIDHKLSWNSTSRCWYINSKYFNVADTEISLTVAGQQVDKFDFDEKYIKRFVQLLYIQLIDDGLSGRAQIEHISPVILRLRAKEDEINDLFDLTNNGIWNKANFAVINLKNVSLDMKKILPLLITKKEYSDHKSRHSKGKGKDKALTIIIDEAHNILSEASFRESESWKDYRLETFEEVIKEGRKFGVFVTLASQRPNDISPTIISQAHNYFIHRLVNQKDLDTISNAVSYIDRLTEESIPILPTGTCIFSGVAGQRPLKINIKELLPEAKPTSNTLRFSDIVSSIVDGPSLRHTQDRESNSY